MTISLVLAAGLPGRQAYRFLSVFHEVWNLTRANYVEPVSEESLLDGAYRGMLASLDAASAYLPPGEETGILEPSGPGRTGLEVLPSGGVPIVVRVDPDTPADRAGIQPGDQIWRIGGSSARQLSWPQLRRRMTGQAGAALDLSVLDGRTFRVRTVSLALEVPKDPGFTIDRVPGGVAHLRLRSLERVDPNVLASRLKTGLAEGGAASSLLVD
ncbi:MAG: PDZ domain-containing protein, partial [Acidobacteria bacterium]|nr:PDZ domain-containing protein [Acidobacteriota bacterium]